MGLKRWIQLSMTALLCAGLAACGGGSSDNNKSFEDRTYTIGVNGYLWRATLDTLSFMPMAQVDGGTGVILTEWYINPDVPTERLKVSVYILDKDLGADSITVNAFREILQNDEWISAPVRAGTAQKIEEAVLTRARELRIGTLEGKS